MNGAPYNVSSLLVVYGGGCFDADGDESTIKGRLQKSLFIPGTFRDSVLPILASSPNDSRIILFKVRHRQFVF